MAAIEYNAKGGPLRPGDEHLGLSPNALRVLEKRYFLKDSEGRIIETPAKLFRRVAHNLAQADRLYDPAADLRVTEEKFYQLMAGMEFLPNSPTLMNAGAGADLSLSACFVLPVGDSLREIFDALKWQALIHQAGGGTGFSFSRLRPAGDMVKSTQGVASGPVSFMKIFDAATDQIKQGGRRRGANMGILRVDHPDIGEFITCKEDVHEITNFNISVAVTDRFMEAVRKGEKYDLINPRTGKVVKQLDARTVFDKIAHQAWRNGEPGLFFIDITNRTNPCPNIGEFEATNPCVAGDTIVMTDRGPMAVKDLHHLAAGEPVKVATDDRTVGGDAKVTLREAQGVYKTGIKTIWRLTTRAGFRLRATYDHRILTPRGWVELGMLRRGDNILVQPLATPTPWAAAPAETVEAIPLAADGGRVTFPFEDEVVAVEKWGKEVVYDIAEPMTHSFIANGIVVHNCVVGDSMISTERGLMTIAEMARRYPRGGISIVTDRRVSARVVSESNGLLMVSTEQDQAEGGTRLGLITGAWCSGVKPVWKLVTDSGFEIQATEDHKFFTTEGKVAVRDLKVGDRLLIQSGEGRFPEDRALPFKPANIYVGENGKTTRLNLPSEWSRELGLVLGWLVGDGWIRCGDKNCRVGFTFSQDDAPMFSVLKRVLNNWYGSPIAGVKRENGVYHLSYHSKFFVDFFVQLGAKPVDSAQKEVPASIFQAPRDAVVAFLQALFTADGTVRDHPDCNSSGIALTSKSLKLLKGVQLLLLNLGMRARILNRSRPPRTGLFSYVNKEGERRTYGSDGVLYELFMFGEARDRFRREIGFLDEKQAHLNSVRHLTFRKTVFEDRLVEKTFVGEREVYDLTEPASHSMVASGLAMTQCGEQPLLAFESCNLGSIVLDKHMKRVGKAWEMDWGHLERSVRSCVHLLDNIIDMNNFPIPQIEELTKATRKIGLGVMGFARVLFKLGVAYDSPEGVEWGRRIMQFINDKSMDESQRLAEKRGVYPAWKGSMHEKMGRRMRNSYVTTVAPTGTICMIADTSGGCEPEFSLIWYKNVMDGDHLPYMLDHFMDVAREEGFWSEDLVEKILANHGSCRGLKEVPERWQRAFATSHDITPEWHVRMQAAFQESCSAAVSKTINLPHEATVEDVKKAYLMAYDLGCKGITVYRDSSRPEQVLNVGVDAKRAEVLEATEEKGGVVEVKVPPVIKPRPRPDVVTGRTQRIRTGYGNLFVTVNEDEFGLVEVFAQIGRGGGYTASFTEAVARLISICLRSGVPVEEIIKQLEGIRSPRLAWDHQEAIFSVPDALAKALRRHVSGQVQGQLPSVESFEEKPQVRTDTERDKEVRDDTEAIVRAGFNPECPECGQPLIFEESCVRCRSCGYSEC